MAGITEEEARLFHRYICEGVGDPKRLMIIYLVAERPYNVTELTDLLNVSQPTVSHHLRILRDRGIVEARREGTTIYYTLGDPRIIQALELLRYFVVDKLEQDANVVQ